MKRYTAAPNEGIDLSTSNSIDNFNFDYPSELVASSAVEPRDSSKLLVMQKGSDAIEHHTFRDLPQFLNAGDCVVINRTKVLPCQVHGRKSTGGKVSLLLVAQAAPQLWRALSSGLKAGHEIILEGDVRVLIEGLNSEGEYLCRFLDCHVSDYMIRHGSAPLPPYILKKRGKAVAEDILRYQTVYAKDNGSIAAPTAGLHFTDRLLLDLKCRGVEIVELTLHVGRGTFRPITSVNITQHSMLSEDYAISAESLEQIIKVKKNSKRVIAVGTTVTRALETIFKTPTKPGPTKGSTDLYIYPGHQFNIVDALITNFHLPRSTPLLLASAFAGREKLLNAYAQAISQKYRLFSYGDAMLIR